MKLVPDSPEEKPPFTEGHWNEQGHKTWRTKDYMTCPREPAGTQLA
jgi:hypothetical protein